MKLFEDWFKSGDLSAWLPGGLGAVASTNYTYLGSVSAKCEAPNGAASSVLARVAPQHKQVSFIWHTLFPVMPGFTERIWFGFIYEPMGGPIVSVSLVRDVATLPIKFEMVYNFPAYANPQKYYWIPFAAGVWHKFELIFSRHSTEGGYWFRVNDVEFLSATGLDTTGGVAGDFYAGIIPECILPTSILYQGGGTVDGVASGQLLRQPKHAGL